MQTAVGVDREVASAPTLCQLEKSADRATAWRLHRVPVEQFIASFKSTSEELCWTSMPPTTRCTAAGGALLPWPSLIKKVAAATAAKRHQAAPGGRVQLRRAELGARAARHHATGVGRTGLQPALHGHQPRGACAGAVRRSELPARRGQASQFVTRLWGTDSRGKVNQTRRRAAHATAGQRRSDHACRHGEHRGAHQPFSRAGTVPAGSGSPDRTTSTPRCRARGRGLKERASWRLQRSRH